MGRKVAFYAPMKSPDHRTPSGDRRVARLLMKALSRGGWDVELASRLRTYQREGNKIAQDYLFQEAERIAGAYIEKNRGDPPALWFTYHCYYKSPDLIGPTISRHFGIPYVVAEGYRALKRMEGPYARYAKAAAQALDHAQIIFYLSHRGLDALERDRPEGQRLVHLPPFTALGEEPVIAKNPDGPLKLVTVAMMREGDKAESYRLLAESLRKVKADWKLTVIGDGAAAREVKGYFSPIRDRVEFLGQVNDRDIIRASYEAADLMVWPGVNEAFGMVYLEAAAAGAPCVAQDRDGVREVIGPTGRLTDPEDPDAFAAAIDELAADRKALAAAAVATREHLKAHHGVNAASRLISEALGTLL